MTRFTKTFLTLLAFAAILPSQSMAEKSGQPGAIASEKDSFAFATAVSNEELDNYRGMATDTTLMFSNLTAQLQGNSANGNITGANAISNGALNNVAGLTNIIQNSGNNVIIQQSTQVNVNFQ